MPRAIIPLLFAVSTASCGGPHPRVGSEWEILSASPARGDLVLAVAPPALEGRCDALPDLPQFRGTLSLVFGNPARRRVNVTVDSDGDPVRYNDMRGDLDIREPHGDRTFIQVDFATELVTVINRKDGVSELARPDFASALDDERLGRPRAMIEVVRGRCGEAP